MTEEMERSVYSRDHVVYYDVEVWGGTARVHTKRMIRLRRESVYAVTELPGLFEHLPGGRAYYLDGGFELFQPDHDDEGDDE